MIYTIPMANTIGFVIIFKSSSAPDITKNRMFSGDDQRSVLSINSSEASHMLQKTAPNIIQVSSSEKPKFTPPMFTLIEAIPTVNITKATATDRRLLLEWK